MTSAAALAVVLGIIAGLGVARRHRRLSVVARERRDHFAPAAPSIRTFVDRMTSALRSATS